MENRAENTELGHIFQRNCLGRTNLAGKAFAIYNSTASGCLGLLRMGQRGVIEAKMENHAENTELGLIFQRKCLGRTNLSGKPFAIYMPWIVEKEAFVVVPGHFRL